MKSECDMRYESKPRTPSRTDELQTYCENLEDRIEKLEEGEKHHTNMITMLLSDIDSLKSFIQSLRIEED